MKHVVFADPNNQAAKNLQADALEQLGYQTEDPTWRNEFLMGAFELRNGVPNVSGTQTASPDTIRAMTVEMVLDFMGMRIDSAKADGKIVTFNLIMPDRQEKYAVTLKNSALTYTKARTLTNPDATLTLPKSSLDNMLLKTTTFDKEVAAGRVKIEGDSAKFTDFLGMLVNFDPMFKIVTP